MLQNIHDPLLSEYYKSLKFQRQTIWCFEFSAVINIKLALISSLLSLSLFLPKFFKQYFTIKIKSYI